MQILYGGIQIALERPQGTDGVLGFQLPKAEQNKAWMEGLRAQDAIPRSYANRKRTISGNIYPLELATEDAATLARMQFYELLPLSGPLVIAQGTTLTTYGYAVLGDIDVVEDATFGVTYGLKFSFDVGPPTFSTNNSVLVTSTGKAVVTSTGFVIRA